MPIKQLTVIASKALPEKADMQVTINVNDSGVPTVVEPVTIPTPPPALVEPAPQPPPVAEIIPVAAPPTLMEVVEDNSPPMVDNEESDAEAIVTFLRMYLDLVGGLPSQAQIENLASALCWDRTDLQVILVQLTGGLVDDEIIQTTRDADLQGLPGLNIPGDLDSFANNDIKPIGKTSIHDIEMPGTLKLFSSASKDVEFVQPMSYMDNGSDLLEDDVTASEEATNKVKADVAPMLHRTGVDDGAPVSPEADREEQEALINDGETDTIDLIDEVNNNRYLNDDGLT